MSKPIYKIQGDNQNEWFDASGIQINAIESFIISLPGTREHSTYVENSNDFNSDTIDPNTAIHFKFFVRVQKGVYYIINRKTLKQRQVFIYHPPPTPPTHTGAIVLESLNLSGGVKYHKYNKRRYKIRYGQKGGKYITANKTKIYIK